MEAQLGPQVLERWREKKKLNQEQASRVICVDPAVYSKIANGKRRVNARLAEQIERGTLGEVPAHVWTR